MMRYVKTAVAVLFALSLIVPLQASAIGKQAREFPVAEQDIYIEEEVSGDSASLNDEHADLFLELEIIDSFLENEAEVEDFEAFLESDPETLPHIPVDIAWKWGVSDVNLDSDYDPTQELSRQTSTPRFNPSWMGAQDRNYVAGAEVSGALANVDIYTEFGVAGERADRFAEENLTADDFEEAVELDLSGYYMAGGASMGFGRWKVGVEAGYGSSGLSNNTQQSLSFSGVTNSSQLIGAQQVSSSSSTSNTSSGTPSEEDPFKVVYFQGTADRSLTEKLGVKVGALCFAIPEQLISDFEGQDLGLEVFGDISYQFAKSMRYSLYMDYSLTDESFENDNIYQILNRVEFNF